MKVLTIDRVHPESTLETRPVLEKIESAVSDLAGKVDEAKEKGKAIDQAIETSSKVIQEALNSVNSANLNIE